MSVAVSGYNCIVDLSEKKYKGEERVLCMLGAQTLQTLAGVPNQSLESIVNVAKSLQSETFRMRISRNNTPMLRILVPTKVQQQWGFCVEL
jgi:hypothetical protein